MTSSELIYRQLLASGITIDAVLAVVAVLKAAGEEEGEGHWVTIEGRPVFIRGPKPKPIELAPVVRDEKSIDFEIVLNNGRAVERAILQHNPELNKALRRIAQLQDECQMMSDRIQQMGLELQELNKNYPATEALIQEKEAQLDKAFWDHVDHVNALAEAQSSLFRSGGEFTSALAAVLGRAEPLHINDEARDNRAAVDSAKQWLGRVIGATGPDSCTIRDMGPGGGSRSYYEPEEKAMYLGRGVEHDEIIHEYGHFLEDTRPSVKYACLEFLQRRYQQALRFGSRDEAAILPLGELTAGQYHHSEVAFADKFFDPYVGRIYREGGSEVMSMGLQYLAYNPWKFREKDPEHYYLILGLIAHVRKNPADHLNPKPPHLSAEPWANAK
jgi:hypothetical protein